MSLPKFSVVIPVYNEGENIFTALTEIKNKVHGDFEVLVVYDFDGDTTLPVVKRFTEEDLKTGNSLKVRLVKNEIGRGVLNALKQGFQSAQSDFIIVTMADLSDPPEVMNDMLAQAVQSNSYVVCASRYMKGGKQIGGPLLKRTLSRLAGVSMSWFTGIPTKDITNNFRLYRREIFQKIEIESSGGFELAMELTIKAFFNGFQVSEVPTTWTDRVAGESRFQMKKWLPKYLKWYFFGLKKKLGII
jgi:dolichol-phosphate mannosyltransferase